MRTFNNILIIFLFYILT